ncbi:baseplate J/gp47 family protein [Pannonibacter sp. P2PFMT1]|uniref:baseplate J/gp47 family protein n=1 Tax=Pannonibacter sp. P2PFMT1 TaxID=2003582 RepID=UPI0016461610|nr:baseplate J/gp47 family protein [Pannonibacter sp. P2PFMT1]
MYRTGTIDLSRLPPPTAIDQRDEQAFGDEFIGRFLAVWEEERAARPDLPQYDLQSLRSEPVAFIKRAFAYCRLLDRQRVNDAYLALLAVHASGSNLDSIAASRNIERLTVAAASGATPAIMEGDSSLLRRYLLSFDRPAAGSAGRYLYEAWRVWPQSEDKTHGIWDARVNGFEVHGRRGDTDLVIIGPSGRLPTELERATVRDAVTAPHIKVEAVSVAVVAATRVEYSVSLVIEVPGSGPAPSVVQAEAEARVRAAATDRTLIGGEIPAGLLSGAAYGANVTAVRDLSPVIIAADPYKVPVMTGLTIAVEVRS